MGLTFVDAQLIGANDRRVSVRFLVDSGAGYSLLPKNVWEELGLKASRSVTVSLADGTHLSRDVSECKIEIQDRNGTTPVLLGEPGDEPLLGVITLENLGLILNPFNRILQPMQVRI